MRILLHIGPDTRAVTRLQSVLAAKRGQLAGKGVLYPRSPGNENHTRLHMAVSEPGHVDALRHNRGFSDPVRQARLRADVAGGLAKEIASQAPELLVLSASQFAQLARRSELEQLREMLGAFSDDIRVVAHVDAPAALLARHYAAQVLEGRASGLEVELGLGPEWWEAALAAAPAPKPGAGVFAEVQGPPFWLDYERLVSHWESVFGVGRVALRSSGDALWGAGATEEIRAAFGIEPGIGKADPVTVPEAPSAAWIARGRQFNALALRMLERSDRVLPRPLWMRFMEEMRIEGEAIDPASLHEITARFAPMLDRLAAAHPGLSLTPPCEPAAPWREVDPGFGFRASQYLAAFLWRIDKATAEAKSAPGSLNGHATVVPKADMPSEAARALLPPEAIRKYQEILRSPFKPHNRLGRVDEETPGTPFTPVARRALPAGSTGNLIVACMKDEAPYVLEWIAYHRAIGFDNFLIYTNNCSDGTDTILSRLDEMGVVHHRRNDHWTGNSPQQFALDAAMEDPVFKAADWVAHIDVDEFVNIRCGNGTLADLFARTAGATNIAMTWRLFGHDGVTAFEDRPVTAQFTACAPKFAPKPHTAWGFKTLFRNNGIYSKLSCHRPNRPDADRLADVTWVNGSGDPMGPQVVKTGWRNSRRSIGYDLVQLNHYALRSAESYLVKRQRGRALHVDRSIGLNYWIRMDWNDTRDVTIQRNLPRLEAEIARLRADPALDALHEAGVAWHRAKAAELHENAEFETLYEQALAIRLNGIERVAYALALDMES